MSTSGTDDSARPIGLLGGTFDPVHYGHLRLAEEAREALGLARVLFSPAGAPAHRPAPAASAAHRRAMLAAALADNPHFALETFELERDAPSYTVETLTALRAREGGARPLVWIIGSDAFAALHTWRRWRELFALAHFAIAQRPGQTFDAPPDGALAAEYRARRVNDPQRLRHAAAGCLIDFAMTPLAISATAIRANLARGASNRYLLPAAVANYIDHHQPYPVEPTPAHDR